MIMEGVCEISFLECLSLACMCVLAWMGVCLHVFMHVLILYEDTCV